MKNFRNIFEEELDESNELATAFELMNRITNLFPNGEIFIVGGVPRDLVMGNKVEDVDLATNIPFEDLAKHFELRNISKNDSQPVFRILFGDFAFDLAKFREDSKTVGRDNNVSVETNDFATDCKRRDITINSFGIDPFGNLVDHQNGMADLMNGLIRTVGNPRERFLEDATRILRVFRFAAKMGFQIEDDTRQAAIDMKYLLLDNEMISRESIAKEFYKAAKSGPAFAQFIRNLMDAGILNDILPEFVAMEGFMHNPRWHPEGGSTVIGHILECLVVSPFDDPVKNLAVFFHDFGKAVTKGEKNGLPTYKGHESAGVPIVESIFDRLRFNELTANDKKNILEAVGRHMLIHDLDALKIKTLTNLVLNPAWDIVKSVGFCDEASRGPELFDREIFEQKIANAENRVKAVGGASPKQMRNTIKAFINGDKLLAWFPEVLQNPPNIKHILSQTEEFVLNKLEENIEPNQDEIQNFIKGVLV